VAGQYRMVQVFGTTATVDSRDVDVSRCSEASYPYNASNQNPVTKLQDGPVRRLYEGVTAAPETGVSAVEFWSDGRAFKVDSGGARSDITTFVTFTLTKGVNTKRIIVNGLGKIQIQ
jgi:hypothetical protein